MLQSCRFKTAVEKPLEKLVKIVLLRIKVALKMIQNDIMVRLWKFLLCLIWSQVWEEAFRWTVRVRALKQYQQLVLHFKPVLWKQHFVCKTYICLIYSQINLCNATWKKRGIFHFRLYLQRAANRETFLGIHHHNSYLILLRC